MPPAAVTLATILSNVLNSAGATKTRASDIIAQSRGLDSADVFQMTGLAIVNLQNQINTYQDQIGALIGLIISGSIPGSGGSTADVLKVLVVGGSTTNIVPTNITPSDGDALVVKLTMDATTGAITWAAVFKGVGVNDIDPTPTLLNFYLFYGVDGFWCNVGLPRLGVAP